MNVQMKLAKSPDFKSGIIPPKKSFKEALKGRFLALTKTLGGFEKQFGKGVIMLLGDESTQNIKSIHSGSLALNRALGVGGYPCGRIVEIFGSESSGKTTLALHAVAEVQKAGGIAAFIDAEHALDIHYARNLGVDVDHLVIAQPDSGEQALEICEQLCKSGTVDLVVIDSVAALTPRAEIEGAIGDAHMGLQARLMSQALRKLTSAISKTECSILFLNQLRQKIGVVFGNPEITTGGNALKYYATMRLDVRRVQTLKDDKGPFGTRTRVQVVKNKVSSPFREAEFDLIFGSGICRAGELLDLGIKEGLIENNGIWWSMNNERIGQGREKSRQFLRKNTDKQDWLFAMLVQNKGAANHNSVEK